MIDFFALSLMFMGALVSAYNRKPTEVMIWINAIIWCLIAIDRH